MKIYIEVGGKYILFTTDMEYSNIDNEIFKTELINNSMDILEENKLKQEIAKEKLGGYLVKKMGLHPDMQKSA